MDRRLLVRWMLVLEDSDKDRLYFGKELPREWVTSGKRSESMARRPAGGELTSK
ncbi:MAG TPA: hypothetical protein VH596_07200 [Terriglobales bacterium]|jgi:hypothetical protein